MAVLIWRRRTLQCIASGLLMLLVSCGFCGARRKVDQATTDYTPKLLEEPLAQERQQTKIARYGSYSVAYHCGWRQPQWVAYRLDATRLADVVDRKGVGFRADPILSDFTLDNQSFKGTGYSRGHLKPAADSKSSMVAMRESFYFTNVSPQLPRFNSGIWNSLEMWVRRQAERSDIMYIVTGPCFLDAPLDYMGGTRVPVATHFYKALLKRHGNRWSAVGFVVPHNLNRKAKLWEFSVSIDSLEKLTDIDFFPLLADSIESVVEASVLPSDWR